MAKSRRDTIRIDYGTLHQDPAAGLSPELLRRAQFFWGQRARREVLRVMDQFVRAQAVEVSHREVNPQLLYQAGRDALSDAIKAYRVGQRESFKEFAKLMVCQAMTNAKEKICPSPATLKPKIEL